MNAFATANFSGPSTFLNGTLTPLQWGAVATLGPQAITHTTNTANFQVSAAGAYLVTVNMTINTTGFTSTGQVYLAIQTSSNGTTFNPAIIVPQNYQFPANQNIYCYGVVALNANYYLQVALNNTNGGAVGFTTNAGYSTIQITRVA
jgi:hypothetical protein